MQHTATNLLTSRKGFAASLTFVFTVNAELIERTYSGENSAACFAAFVAEYAIGTATLHYTKTVGPVEPLVRLG